MIKLDEKIKEIEELSYRIEHKQITVDVIKQVSRCLRDYIVLLRFIVALSRNFDYLKEIYMEEYD